MGMTSSTDMKPENCEPESQKNQVQSEKLGDRLEAFIKGGGCKETYMAFQDCVEEAEKKKKEPISCYTMLDKCMEAHSTYYQPILGAEKSTAQVLMKELMPSIVWRYPVESVSPEEEKEAERFLEFMKGGGCKESFTAWEDCREEAIKSNLDIVTKCVGVFSKVTKCMDAQANYYHPFIAAKKTAQEHLEKELQAFFSQES